jgi:uncharacterized membrane protein YcgQ (UPF0703/DUF1980 family)
MKRIYSIIGSLSLLAVAGIVFYLVASGKYQNLLNPKFMPLTVAAGILMAILGAITLFSAMEMKLSTALILILFVLLALVAPSVKLHASPTVPGRETLNGVEFIPINIIELYMQLYNNSRKKVDDVIMKNHYVFHGFVCRSEKLDQTGDIAVMRVVISCCIADACAYGFRVKIPDVGKFSGGRWVKVYGHMESIKSDGAESSVEVPGLANSDIKNDVRFIPDEIRSDSEPESQFIYKFHDKEPFVY